MVGITAHPIESINNPNQIKMSATKPSQTKVGVKFGTLIPTVGFHAKNSRGKTKLYYRCDCDCGTKDHVVPSYNLRNEGGVHSCGCNWHTGNRAKDITGEKFGRLTAIQPTEKRWRKNIVWLFKCDCGRDAELPLGEVVALKRQSCGCKRKYTDREEAMWTKTKTNALRRSGHYGCTSDLNLSAYISITTQNCFYCGAKPKIPVIDKTSDLRSVRNTLDRINPQLGYLESNVLPCCLRCNQAKSDMSYMEWVNFLIEAHEHFIESQKYLKFAFGEKLAKNSEAFFMFKDSLVLKTKKPAK